MKCDFQYAIYQSYHFFSYNPKKNFCHYPDNLQFLLYFWLYMFIFVFEYYLTTTLFKYINPYKILPFLPRV